MRVLVSILFSVVAVFAEDPQALAPSAQAPDNLTIPVRLSKAIDTNKCKTGDPVEMRTLESVLIANGIVMPENAKLHGRILGSASRQDNQPSWVVMLVEQAEWKQHSIPLHAFVAAQITIRAALSGTTNNAFDGTNGQLDILRRRQAAHIPRALGRGPSAGLSRTLQDATVERNGAPQLNYQGIDDLRITQDKNGNVFLVSQKRHLKLPSGTMFMLRNRLTVPQNEMSATTLAGSPR
jgi:hypothetical protein